MSSVLASLFKMQLEAIVLSFNHRFMLVVLISLLFSSCLFRLVRRSLSFAASGPDSITFVQNAIHFAGTNYFELFLII